MTNPQNIFYDNGVVQVDYTTSYQYLKPTTTTLYQDEFVINLRTNFVGISVSDNQVKALLSKFFAQYGTSNPLPKTFYDFNTAWNIFAQNTANQQSVFGTSTNTYSDPGSSGGTTNKFYEGLFKNFNYLTLAGEPLAPRDWEPLNSISSLNAMTNPNNPFIIAFEYFLKNYNYPNGGKIGTESNAYSNFIDQFTKFFGAVAVVRDSTVNNYANITGVPFFTYFKGMPTYESIFRMFGPSYPSESAFQSAFGQVIRQFAADQLKAKGYFLPSQSFDDWLPYVKNVSGMHVSPLDENNGKKALILNRLIQLLISLVTTLQGVAVVQAKRLNFTTSFQQVYTSLQTQIQPFLKGANIDGKQQTNWLTSTNIHNFAQSTVAQDRNNINASFNSFLTDNLRSIRGIQEDKAKQLQTNLNQTNDAVNQQTDLATSFLQQLSSLLNSIFR